MIKGMNFFQVVAACFMTAGFILSGCQDPERILNIEQWDLFEKTFTGPSNGNPYMDVEFSADFTNGDKIITIPGFYDGDGQYFIRFSPAEKGTWSYQTRSNRDELDGMKGSFSCVSASGSNHGPVMTVNTHYLQYADESPFYCVGTTAYQWTSVKQPIQEKTINTLTDAPFNKVRMCFFPKSYRYGNDTEPWMYPFSRENGENDFSRPNYEFFRNFDLRVKQLMNMGIQADVILFHPYDAWGYSQMGDQMNKKYVRYMIARLSAYRNVWWSLANEWDVPSIRDSIDWESIGLLLQREDPHHRMRGIHNWYDTEDHFYDHSKPWITHVSAQTSQFYNAVKWREQYKKPLLFDEMRYEGDVPSGWGNLTGEEMASYFWMAGLSGAYGTHGETIRNHADDSTEVRWWAKGGELVGESPERIRFFRQVMEAAPVVEMAPSLNDQGDPENLDNNIYMFSKPGHYYLVYVGHSGQTIEMDLVGEKDYQLDVIDTWNMQVVDREMIKPGKFRHITKQPYTALRIYHD